MIKVLSPYTPHLCEEIWQRLGQTESLAYQPWPKYDLALTKDDEITVSIQVNGKLRGTLAIPKDMAKDDVLAAARNLDSVAKHLAEKNIRKEIYVPGKIVNFVAN